MFANFVISVALLSVCNAQTYNAWTAAQSFTAQWLGLAVFGDYGYANYAIMGGDTYSIYRSYNLGASQYLVLNVAGALNDIATNGDGSYLIGVGTSNAYITSNGGTTWNTTTISGASSLTDVAIDNTATYVATLSYAGNLYVSTNAGKSFTTVSGISTTYCVTVSGNGQYMAAGALNGIYVSSNYGSSFSQKNSMYTTAIANSYTGQFIISIYSGSTVYVSNNYGTSWTAPSTPSSSPFWYQVAMSSSGQLMAAANSYGVYISNNVGVTWSDVFAPPSSYITLLAMDYSGIYQYGAGPLSQGGVMFYDIDTTASILPSFQPSPVPTTRMPTAPTKLPTVRPTTLRPTVAPTKAPTVVPTSAYPVVASSDSNSSGGGGGGVSSGAIAGIVIVILLVAIGGALGAYLYVNHMWCFNTGSTPDHTVTGSSATASAPAAVELNKNAPLAEVQDQA